MNNDVKIPEVGNAIFLRKSNPERVHSYKTFRILILGIPRVGKTSILNRFLNDFFSEQYVPTTKPESHETGMFLELNDKLKRFDLVFHDYSGTFNTLHAKMYRSEIENNDGFILVHTKNEIESFPQVLEMVSDIKKMKGKDSCVLVVENKCDELCYYGDTRASRRSFDMDGCINSAVSSKNNKNITEAIAMLVKEMDKKWKALDLLHET